MVYLIALKITQPPILTGSDNLKVIKRYIGNGPLTF